MYLAAVDPLLLIPIRFFHGMATAILGPVVGAVIAEEFGEHKGEMLGTYSSATLAGRSASPNSSGLFSSLRVSIDVGCKKSWGCLQLHELCRDDAVTFCDFLHHVCRDNVVHGKNHQRFGTYIHFSDLHV